MTRPLRLALVPLDERHWVSDAPVKIGRIAGCEVLVPPRHMLGDKKELGKFEELGPWLRAVASEVDGLVVAVETLAYGGLIASRTTDHPLEECWSRVQVLKEIREDHPGLPIYAFTLVMRIPAYDNDEQEPWYWAHYGARIHRYSQLLDKVARHGREEDKADLEQLKKEIPPEVLENWHWRRNRNHELSKRVLDYVADGTVDFLLITQDDSAEYGVSSMEQKALRARISELGIEERALLYPGADEVAMVLVARHVNRHLGIVPKVYPRYSSTKGPFLVPRYEDRPLAESVKGQIYAVGGRLVETPQEADWILFLNTPGEAQEEAPRQDVATMVDTPGRNLLDFTEAILHYTEQGKPAAVADVAYSNGADRQFVKLLLRRVGLKRIMAYAAWNTAGNTLGTVVAHASVYHAVGRHAERQRKLEAARAHLEFLLERFIEDWGYQAVVRTHMGGTILPALGIPYMNLGDRWKEVEGITAEQIQKFTREHFSDMKELELHWYGEPLGIVPTGLRLENIRQPWRRMFNLAFDVKLDFE